MKAIGTLLIALLILPSIVGEYEIIKTNNQPNYRIIHIIYPEDIENLKEEQKTIIIDVRDREEYDAGHIEGAICLPIKEIENKTDELMKLYKGWNIIVYCTVGIQSEMVCEYLAEKNFAKIYHLEGGIALYKANGYKISTDCECYNDPKFWNDSWLIMDVRDAKDYEEWHYKHAIHIPANKLSCALWIKKLKEIFGDKNILLYGDDKEVSKATRRLLASFNTIYLMNEKGNISLGIKVDSTKIWDRFFLSYLKLLVQKLKCVVLKFFPLYLFFPFILFSPP